jgi:small subunit ribosomal protein S1
MTENFAQLFEESLQELETRPGSIVKGTVVSIDKDIVLVDAGLKSESAIPADQFKNAEGELEIAIGDEVDVALDAVEDGFGETILSREKAKRHEAWVELEKAYDDKATIKGVINGKVKGGFTVEVNSVRAFLPGSLVDVRPVRDTTHLEGKSLNSKLSNWTRSATTLWFLVVLLLKLKTVQNVSNFWRTWKKATKSKVSLRT